VTTQERSLHVTWEDPIPGAKAARGMAGIEYLRAILAGLALARVVPRM
jgi:hypothetical protein